MERKAMWMVYDRRRFKKLEEDTYLLSLAAARYEVHHDASKMKVLIRVRCRRKGRVYDLCKSLHYVWGTMPKEET